jgi:hypothetical protein
MNESRKFGRVTGIRRQPFSDDVTDPVRTPIDIQRFLTSAMFSRYVFVADEPPALGKIGLGSAGESATSIPTW